MQNLLINLIKWNFSRGKKIHEVKGRMTFHGLSLFTAKGHWFLNEKIIVGMFDELKTIDFIQSF